MALLAHVVGQGAQGQQIVGPVEGDAVLEAQAPAGRTFSRTGSRAWSRILKSLRVVGTRGSPLGGSAGHHRSRRAPVAATARRPVRR